MKKLGMKNKMTFSNIMMFLWFFTSFTHGVFDGNYLFQLESVTQATLDAINTPQKGMMTYNIDDNKVYVYDGVLWSSISSGNQDINGTSLSGATLTVGITNGNSDTVNLSSLIDDADANETNELQTLSITGQDISLSDGGGTVTVAGETTTNLSQDVATGIITYTNESASGQTANTISSDADNQIITGSDGGAYLGLGTSVYNGFFTISSAGNQVITGLPFQPSQVTFVAHANIENTDIDSDNDSSNNDRGIRNSFGTMNGMVRDEHGTLTQQIIYVGGHGNSINNISRYASSSNCIGVRYGDQNGDDLGKITASLGSFDATGFNINVTYSLGTVNNSGHNILPTDINDESLIVLFTAYK